MLQRNQAVISLMLFASLLTLAPAAARGEDETEGEGFMRHVGVQGGISWGIGKMGNDSGASLAIQDRTMNALGLKGFASYDLRTVLDSLPFRLGVGLFPEFRFVGQNTDPSSVANTNMRGFQMLWGLAFGADWEDERISTILSFDFFGRYWMTNQTPAYQASVLSKQLGLRLLVGYKVQPKLSVDGVIQLCKFGESNIVPGLNGLSISQTSFGVGVRYFFR